MMMMILMALMGEESPLLKVLLLTGGIDLSDVSSDQVMGDDVCDHCIVIIISVLLLCVIVMTKPILLMK